MINYAKEIAMILAHIDQIDKDIDAFTKVKEQCEKECKELYLKWNKNKRDEIHGKL